MTLFSLIIFGLLALATLFIQIQILKDPSTERFKNRLRIFAWWIIFAICFCCFSLGLVGVTALSVSLMVWASLEFSQLLKLNKVKVIIVAGLIAAILISSMVIWPEISKFFFFITLLMAALSNYLPIRSKMFIPAFFLYYLFALSSIILIFILATSSEYESSYLLLVLFFIVAVNDIAQYVTGKIFGKTKIAPIISPNKTLEGIFGGLIVSGLLGVLLLTEILSISWIESLFITTCLSIAGFLGDLILSRVKRGLHIKDTGSSIMGHGGLFDRIDSLLLVIPIFGVLMVIGGYF